MTYLKAVRFDRVARLPSGYPFNIPAVATLERIEFRAPVTLFAGENGTGKSTLLEGIAAGIESISVRADDPLTERTLTPTTELGRQLRFEWSTKTRRGFFLRAEDFFDFTKRISQLTRELETLAAEFDERLTGYGRQLARGTALGQRRTLLEKYGEDLNARSHGESFLQFFRARFTGPGVYLLDEPDTALSPQSVLGLMAMLIDLVREGAQLIIATHSPMLMALPGATIISFDRAPVAEVAYDQVEQIELMRTFLNRPEAFLRHL